jgi:2,3-bisphosphoglycerate-independent phosphoglycerate mutase
MKYAVILPDGASDDPLDELGGKTPLEAANIPHTDRIALSGRLGRLVTIPDGFTPATDVGTLSLFGYDPAVYYTGRAPLEAAARNLTTGPGGIIFRCNFVTVLDGLMKDFTAGHIAQDEADRLIADLNTLFAGEGMTFHAGVSYRNLLIVGDASGMDPVCQPPHDIPDQPIADYPPKGTGADRVQTIMDRAAEMIEGHEVNRVRKEEGRDPVTGIWLWGQGRPAKLVPFRERFGVSGAVITGVDIIRGLAACMGMDLIEVDGATGYIDTNYAGKGEAAVQALDEYDMVVVHVEAADEAGHMGDAGEKVLALERIDEYIVGPLTEAVTRYGDHRILIAADHPTPVTTRAHSAVPPLFCYAGTGIESVEKLPFHDRAAEGSGFFLETGHTLIDRFMKRD